MKEEVVVQQTGPRSWGSRFTRASWGAIFSGVFVTLVLEIMFTLLGAAIGFSVINPANQQGPNSGQGFAIGSGIWVLVTSLISLWVGACIAGRLSGGPTRSDGLIHGIVTWSVATLATVWLLATAAGALIGGTASLLGNAIGESGNNSQSLTSAARQLFPETKDILPPTGRTQGNQQSPGNLTALAQQDPDLGAALSRMESNGGAGNAQERDQVVNLLVSKHNMDQQQAAALVSQWDQHFRQIHSQVSEKAKQFGQQAAHGLSEGSLWAFVALILGLLVSAWGGWAGTASTRSTDVRTGTVVA